MTSSIQKTNELKVNLLNRSTCYFITDLTSNDMHIILPYVNSGTFIKISHISAVADFIHHNFFHKSINENLVQSTNTESADGIPCLV